MKKIAVITVVLCLVSISLFAQDKQDMKYRRSSLNVVFVEDFSNLDSREKEALSDIISKYELPDKYNDHSVGDRIINVSSIQISKEDTKPYRRSLVGGILNRLKSDFLKDLGVVDDSNEDANYIAKLIKYCSIQHLGGLMIAKWFNLSNTKTDDSYFNMDLIEERGAYNATELDKLRAKETVRGEAMLKDAGMDLIPNTFTVFLRIKYMTLAEWDLMQAEKCEDLAKKIMEEARNNPKSENNTSKVQNNSAKTNTQNSYSWEAAKAAELDKEAAKYRNEAARTTDARRKQSLNAKASNCERQAAQYRKQASKKKNASNNNSFYSKLNEKKPKTKTPEEEAQSYYKQAAKYRERSKTDVGYFISTTSYLFQLEWTEDIADEFLGSCFNTNDPQSILNNERLFKMKYIGNANSQNNLLIDHKARDKDKKKTIEIATIRAIDKAISKLQKKYEVFAVKSPIIEIDNNYASSYIGIKEGITNNSKFEVLEKRYNEKKNVFRYVKVGSLKIDSDRIWDNRYSVEYQITSSEMENDDESDDNKKDDKTKGRTDIDRSYMKGNTKNLAPGMLIRQTK